MVQPFESGFALRSAPRAGTQSRAGDLPSPSLGMRGGLQRRLVGGARRARRRAVGTWILVLVLAAAGVGLRAADAPVVSATSLAAPTISVFTAEADARVHEASAAANYGSSTTLRADGGGDPDVESYLRFAVSGVSGTVQGAKLRVYAFSGTANGPAAYAAGNSWTETGITWSNRPARTGGATDDKGAVSANAWVEYDVTPLVTGNGTYTFALVPQSSDGVDFYSRENGTSKPQLVVTVGGTVSASDPVIAAAGDIACSPSSTSFNGGNGTVDRCRQKYTSDLLVNGSYAKVITLGDNQYSSGSLSSFQKSYDPSWGRVKAITSPSVGNHEYGTAGAAGYFDYFGAAAGERGKGYYSYDIGAWHVVVLNSNCTVVSGGCGAGSPQEQWLRADLAAHPTACTLAYWHHPRWSSGHGGSDPATDAFWRALYEANADLVLVGHSHHYERFAPQGPTGAKDTARGIREFVVGSGGSFFTSISSTIKPNSEVRNGSTYGILELSLHPGSYDWRFVPETGRTFTDSGSTACH